MMLILLIAIPLTGGVMAWLLGRRNQRWPRWISLGALLIDMILALALWGRYFDWVNLPGNGAWLTEVNIEWIPQLGISVHLGMDGLSLLLALLTVFLGIMSVAASWTEIQERVGFFHFNLMWSLAGIMGVFLSLDLFLFYFFWELMLVPMYFLIALWGHERRVYAAVKFFLFTQLSGLLMLAAILGLYFIHGRNTGVYTFDYTQLLATSMSSTKGLLFMLGFLIAFVVKLPAIPFHTWLPDAHTEAPTAGSVILAGLLLKTGAYGMLRFALPLFPRAAIDLAPVAMVLGVIGIIYGAVLAFAQTDLKRLVAYTSISHMGFVLLGVFVGNELALQGVVIQILCHGISTGALFILVGALQERVQTRDISRMGGLWAVMPRMGGAGLFFGLASLGLPGLGNFVGEFLVLMGAYHESITLTAIAATGLVISTIYALWMIQRTFFGGRADERKVPDLTLREMAVMGVMVASLVWIGMYPQPIMDTAGRSLETVRKNVQTTKADEKMSKPISAEGDHVSH